MKNIFKLKIWLIQIVLMIGLIGGVNFVWAQSCPSQTQYSTNYAVLVGAVSDTAGDSNVQVWFDWGTSSALGNSTPIQSLFVTSVPYRFCYTLTNLQPCTTYYYRAVIRNSGGTNYGTIYSFTTRCSSVTNPLTVSCYATPNPANTNSVVNFYAVATGGTGSYNYSWSGACSGFASVCSTSFSTGGNYLANLTVTSGAESRSTVCSVNVNQSTPPVSLNPTITVNQSPVPVVAFSPEDVRPGTIVTFDASRSYDPDGTIVSYRWEINNQVVSSAVTFNRALASGSYRVKLTVTDNRGAEASKEILISVGRTTYLTRREVITQTRTVPVQTASSRLVNLVFEKSYQLNVCSANEIQFTAINNTSVNRQLTIEAQGEIANWFSPQSRKFTLRPNEVQIIKWQMSVPCNVKEGIHEAEFLAKTPGGEYTFTTLFEVKKKTNVALPLLGFIGLFGDLNPLWLLILLLLGINFYLWYRILHRKKTEENSAS